MNRALRRANIAVRALYLRAPLVAVVGVSLNARKQLLFLAAGTLPRLGP